MANIEDESGATIEDEAGVAIQDEGENTTGSLSTAGSKIRNIAVNRTTEGEF